MTQFAFIFQGGGGSMITTFLPFVLIFGVFYFLIIVPQRKRQKALADMVAALKPGDKVITSGGIYGTVVKLSDDTVQLQIANNVRIQVSRAAIVGYQGQEPVAPESTQS